MPPANDNWIDAVDLGSAFSGSVAGDTAGATLEPGESPGNDPIHYGAGDGTTVWYKWTAPAGPVAVLFDTSQGGPIHNMVAMYQGDPTTGADVSGLFRAGWLLDAGTTYYIQIDHLAAGGPTTTFTLSWDTFDTPPNDDFANATNLPAAPTGISNSWTMGATTEPGEPIPSEGPGYGPFQSIWFKWRPANVDPINSDFGDVTPGDVAVSTINSGTFYLSASRPSFVDEIPTASLDTVLAVYTGPSSGATFADLVEVIANDDASGASPPTVASYVNFTPVPGQTYYIQVSCYNELTDPDGADGYASEVGFVALLAYGTFLTGRWHVDDAVHW